MDDWDWILADGESLEDALYDFTAEVENPELMKARHKKIRKIYNVDTVPDFIEVAEGAQDDS
jgi:hypothetical protein